MPLSGVRILDLSRLAPGPYATRLLAELGAEVIKLETPTGDFTRYAPPLAGDPSSGAVFRELNAGKKSITLDLKDAEQVEVCRQLALQADVLIDGFRPGVLTRLGLDPRELMQAHPRLIYCALTGFGLSGPDAQRAGHDVGYLARAGVIDLCGTEDAPVTLGVQIADFGASLVAVSGICAALYERERTGRGKVVDVSLVESGLAFNPLNLGMVHAGAKPRRGQEMLDGSRPCYSIYRTKDDRFMAVGALEPKFWMTFLGVLGMPELADTALDGGERAVEAKAKVQAKLLERTQAEWTEIFRNVDCCVEPVRHADEVEGDEHLAARGIRNGPVIRSPIRVTDWDSVGQPVAAPLSPSPGLGEHTEEVLRQAGVTSDVKHRLK